MDDFQKYLMAELKGISAGVESIKAEMQVFKIQVGERYLVKESFYANDKEVKDRIKSIINWVIAIYAFITTTAISAVVYFLTIKK